MNIINNYLTGLVRTYVADYLDNFDMKQLNFSLWKGALELNRLQLNSKILDNSPLPLKLKYGRIGQVRIEIPSLLKLTSGIIDVRVSDVFVCLESRPFSEWIDNTIIDEFHGSKESSLRTFEEQANTFYIQHQGEELEMSATVLSLIQNIQVTIERVYLRIEDPYPFALGLLIPSITLKTANKTWQENEKNVNTELAFKIVRIEGFSIFMERDPEEVFIDSIIGLAEKPEMSVPEREDKLYSHIADIFAGVGGTTSQVLLGGGQGSPSKVAKKISSFDFILQAFDIDVRLQLTIDKVRAKKTAPNEPHVKLSILCGGLFGESKKDPIMRLEIREDQINALTQFTSVTGVYNTYRTGVLLKFFEKEFDPESPDIQRYMVLYEEYLGQVLANNQQEMDDKLSLLREIERDYQTDVIIRLRRALCERFFGFRKADVVREDRLKELQRQQRRAAGLPADENAVEMTRTNKVLEFISKELFGGRHEEETGLAQIQNLEPQLTPQERESRAKQINFVRAFIRSFYRSRYNLLIEEIVAISKGLQGDDVVLTPQENSTMDIVVRLPKLTLKVLEEKTSQVAEPRILLEIGIEEVAYAMNTESKPVYSIQTINLKNLYIKDPHSPVPAMPYLLQLVLDQDVQHFHTQQANSLSKHNQQAIHLDEWAIEIELETNPRGREGFNRTKLHTKGQLYIYGNLELAKSLVKFAGRVTKVMDLNHNKLVDKAPPAIKEVIMSGKDIDRKLAEKQERAQKEKDEREKQSQPKTDLDIFLRAPKLILYEGLLGESPIVKGQADAIIIDLGQIQVQTRLIKFDKNTDYNEIFEPKDLYDCMLIKLGKVKIFADFKLRVDELEQRSNQSLKWSPSYHMRADITNEINLGCEMHTCLAPNHPTLPASIINAKVEQIKLSVSRRVVQTLLRFVGIYQNGSFNMALSEFLDAQEESKQDGENHANGNDNADDKQIISEGQIRLEQHEAKPPALTGRSEVTWLVQRIGIVVEELVEQESSHQAGQITQVEKYIQKMELSEIGLQGLKGRLETQEKRMQCQAFLQSIYIKHAKAKSERYRYVIGNPKLEKIDIEELKSQRDVFTKMQGINSQRRSNVNQHSNQIHESGCKHGSGDADFSFFTTFNPSLEFKNQTNQLAVLYVSEELDTHDADWTLSQMTVDSTIRNLRITFLAPGLKNILRFYVGLMVDIKDVPKQMKAEFDKRYGSHKDIEEEEKVNTQIIMEEDQRPGRSHKLYSKDGTAKVGMDKKPVGATFRQAVKDVKGNYKEERERKELEKEKALKDTGLSHKKVTEKMIIKATVSDLEVVAPENLYEFPSQALKITLGCDFKMNSSSDYKDTYKNDRARTLLDHELKKSESVMKIGLRELAIYLEQQLSKEDVPPPMESGTHYHLLAPFPLVIDMFSGKTLHSPTNTDSKSIICISGGPIGLHLGLREVSTYLVIAQLIMQFLNDMTIMQQEIDWRARAKVQEIQRKIKRRIKIEQLLEMKGRFDPREVMDEDEKRRLAEKEDKIVTLDEILANEGLKKKEVTAAKAKLKRALQKLNTLSTERHFQDSRIQIDVQGLTIKIFDNSDLNQKPECLLGLEVGELQMKMCTRSYEKMKNVMMERWFKIDNVEKSYSYLRLQLELTGSFYNRNSLAEEMFIEPFPLVIKMSQKSPMSNSSQIILSREHFNINVSYGLVCNVQRTMSSLLKVENDQKAEEARLQWQGTSGPIFEEIMYEPKFKAVKQLPPPSHPFISKGHGQLPQEQKMNSENLEVKFFNHTGLPVRFTLSLLKVPLLAIKDPGQIVKDNRIRVLPPVNPAAQGESSLNIPAKVLEADLSEFSQQNSQRLKQGFLKIDFTIGNFRKLTKVNLQKSGIFGYYLHEDDGRTSNFNTFERSNLSCIVNIQRINNSIHVSFESSLILLNDTSFNLSLKTTNRFNIDQEFTLRPGQVHIAPVTWFVDQASLIHSDTIETTHVFGNLSKIFDPRIIQPTHNHAKVLKQRVTTTGQYQYFSSDIFMLKTKTSVGQFLVVFNPLLKVCNLLFTELLIQKHEANGKEDYNIIKSNTTEPMYEIDPYNPNENKADMRYKEDDNLEYKVQQVALKTKGLKENTVCGFTEGQYVTFKRDIRTGVVDSTVDLEIYVAMEKVSTGHILRNTEYNDFSVRRQAYSSTMSITYVLYFPYIAINKTNIDLQLVGKDLKSTLNAFSSTFLQPYYPKMHLEVSGYQKSEQFDITTLGISGTLVIKQLKPVPKQDSPQLMDHGLAWERQHFLEIGSFFNNCPAPYSKTKLLYFVPRYILKNKLDYPIVVKERNGMDQIVLKPNSERYFNLGLERDSDIMIRALNEQKEQEKIQIMQPIQSEYAQIDIPSVQPQTVTDGVRSGDGGQLESAVKSSRRRLTETYQFNLDMEYVRNDVSHDPMKTWSYYFSLKNVDDFQITVPNLHIPPQPAESEKLRMKQNLEYQKQNGWQKTLDHNFVRVNISPGPEHEATLFVSFHKPFFPEYIFYNSLDTYVLVQHKSTAINVDKKNYVYKLSPKTHKAIVLNPNDKDEDFLIITVLDESGQRPSNQGDPNFIYEIDSLKQHYPQIAKVNGRQYTVITKLSGSLRFIQLMSNQAWKDEKARRRLASNRQVPDDQSEAESVDDDQQVFEEALNGALDLDQDDDDEVERADPNAQSLIASVDNLGRELGSSYAVIPDNNVAADMLGVTIKGIHGSQRERLKKISKMYEVVAVGDQAIAGQEVTKSLLYIHIQGLTLSLVSSDPRELLLLSLHEIVLQRYDVFTNMEDIKKNHQKLNFTIKNIQIDNMLSRSFKVILGPRKPFNFRQSKFRALTKEEHEKKQEGQFFLQFYLDQTNTKESGITSQRIKQLDVALQEINVNAHSYTINHILYFITSLTSMMSDELITNFMDSDTMFNYARLMNIMSMEDDYLQLLIGAGPLAPDHEAKKSLEFEQMEYHKLEQYKNSVKRLMKGLKDNSEVEWQQIDQFFNLNTSKDHQGANLQPGSLKASHNKAMTEQEYYQNQNIKRKEEVVPSLSPEPLTVDERQDYNQSKILVQEISIKAIRLYLTFRMKDLETAMGSSGFLSDIVNFLSSFTNISDASLYFKQIDIKNAYKTKDSIISILSTHYINQGINQIYKILGATDIIGNPVGLISNLGRGVEELYSEPFQGVLSGDMSRAALGLGRGVIGFGKNAAFGIGGSVSRMTGTWYVGLRGFSGRQVSESNLDDPHSIGSGLKNGTVGLGKEIVQGTTGIVKIPKKTMRDSGKTFNSCVKGTCHGIVGFVISPVTGLLKMVYSFSTGIKNQSGDTQPATRFRFPRYFNDMDVMEPYDPVLSLAQASLYRGSGDQNTWFKEVILFAMDVSGFTDVKEHRFKDRVILVTDKRLLFVQSFSKIKLNLLLRTIIQVESFETQLIFRTNDNGKIKDHKVDTGRRPNANALFKNQLERVLENKMKNKLQASNKSQAALPVRQ